MALGGLPSTVTNESILRILVPVKIRCHNWMSGFVKHNFDIATEAVTKAMRNVRVTR